MEPTLGSSICLICFEMTEKHIFVPSDAPEKLFSNCDKYLHSTLTKGTLKDMKLHNENQVPLCKSCFDSALELTQLSEQLTTIQKDISDLSVAFSMAVFHRRSQVYSIGQSCKTASIVEFNEECLPPNLFSKKHLGDPNIQPNKINEDMDINGLHLQTDISYVKCEGNNIHFDNMCVNPQLSVANDNIEIQFIKDNLDKQCKQPTIEQNQNHATVSETRIVPLTCGSDSKKYTDPKNANEMILTTSDLLKSVKMPKIILERIKIVGHKIDVSVVNSNQTNCESYHKNINDSLVKDDKFSVHSFDPESPEDGTLLKCFYCEKTFVQEYHRTIHHKTHTGEIMYKLPLNKQKLFYRRTQKICQITPTGRNPFYKCSYCEKVFSTPRMLQIHTRTHTEEKSFKCSFCNNRFNESRNLKRHEIIHTGEKPLQCSFCNKRCNDTTSLKCHERTHTGERPFKCSFCNNRFSQISTRKYHERTHTGEKPFKCSFCGRGLSSKLNLIVHERIHTEEKPYKCLYCEQTFSRIRDWKLHQKCHLLPQMPSLISQLGNKKDDSLGHLEQEEQMNSAVHMELKCSFCEMTFSYNEERANHEKIHKREDEIVNENLIVGI